MKYYILAFFNFLLWTHPALAMRFAYDAGSQNYFVEDDLGEAIGLLTQEGKAQIFERSFFPLRQGDSPFGADLSISPSPWGLGLMTRSSELLQVDRESRFRKRQLLGPGAVECPKTSPQDTCTLFRMSRVGSVWSVGVIHSALGLIFLKWDGEAFRPMQGAWSQLGLNQLFALNDDAFLLKPLGDSEVLWPKVYGASDGEAYLLSPQGLKTLPFSKAARGGTIAGIYTRDGQQLVLTQEDDKLGLLRLTHAADAPRIEDLSPTLPPELLASRWLGLDQAGNAYSFDTSTGQIWSFDLNSRVHEQIGQCEGNKSWNYFSRGMSENSEAAWLQCGTEIFRLADKQVQSMYRFPAPVIMASIQEKDTAGLSGLFGLKDGRNVLLKDGQELPHQNLLPFGTELASTSTLNWEEGQRMCQGLKRVDKDRQVKCRSGDQWSFTNPDQRSAPLDILETTHLTWYLTESDEMIQVWVRPRNTTATWKLHHEAPKSSTPASGFKLFLGALEDEVGLMGLSQIMMLQPKAAPRILAQSPSEIGNVRPVLAADGWLYTLSPDPATASDLILRSWSPDGQEYILQRIAKRTFALQIPRLLPLARGALLSSDIRSTFPSVENDFYPWQVLYHTQAIPLTTLYGEFKGSTQRPLLLNAWSLPEGQVIIQKLQAPESHEGDGTNLWMSSYLFNGRSLQEIEKKPEVNGEGRPNTYVLQDRFPQMWRNADGLWRRNASDDREMPIVARASYRELLELLPREWNQLRAAKAWGDSLVLVQEGVLWICPKNAGVSISPELPLIERMQGCRAETPSLPIREVLGGDEQQLFVLGGYGLYAYKPSEKTTTPLLSGIQSKDVVYEEQSILYAQGQELLRFDFRSSQTARVHPLPKGMLPSDLRKIYANLLCSTQGLYAWSESKADWQELAKDCRSAIRVEGSTWAFADQALWECQTDQCMRITAYPLQRGQDPVLGYDSGILLGMGRMLQRWTGSAWENCKRAWSLGQTPFGDIKKIEGDIILMQKAGAMTGACQAAPLVYRPY